MQFISRFLIAVLLVGCNHQRGKEISKDVYLKNELSSLATCRLEHVECATATERCVAAPYRLGGSRQCIEESEISLYFGCMAGELIVHPAEPYQLACL